ncbi:hypothetical protein MJO29_015705, partial [Puccinia striiformis f. sp. tritici]
ATTHKLPAMPTQKPVIKPVKNGSKEVLPSSLQDTHYAQPTPGGSKPNMGLSSVELTEGEIAILVPEEQENSLLEYIDVDKAEPSSNPVYSEVSLSDSEMETLANSYQSYPNGVYKDVDAASKSEPHETSSKNEAKNNMQEPQKSNDESPTPQINKILDCPPPRFRRESGKSLHGSLKKGETLRKECVSMKPTEKVHELLLSQAIQSHIRKLGGISGNKNSFLKSPTVEQLEQLPDLPGNCSTVGPTNKALIPAKKVVCSWDQDDVDTYAEAVKASNYNCYLELGYDLEFEKVMNLKYRIAEMTKNGQKYLGYASREKRSKNFTGG